MLDYDNYGPSFGGGHIVSFYGGPHQLGLPAGTTDSSVDCIDNNGYEHCAEGPHAFAGGSHNDWTTVGLEVFAVELVPAYTGVCGVCGVFLCASFIFPIVFT